MRKILTGVAAAALIVGLAGCDRGGEKQAPVNKEQPAAEQTAPASEEAAPADTGAQEAAPAADGEQAPAAETSSGEESTKPQPKTKSQDDSADGEGH